VTCEAQMYYEGRWFRCDGLEGHAGIHGCGQTGFRWEYDDRFSRLWGSHRGGWSALQDDHFVTLMNAILAAPEQWEIWRVPEHCLPDGPVLGDNSLVFHHLTSTGSPGFTYYCSKAFEAEIIAAAWRGVTGRSFTAKLSDHALP
jgi:hypothetical protein